MFNVDLIELPTLIRHDGESRYYETPTGQKYPSVTTVLDKTSDKTHLIRWRKRIGEDEANRQSKRATTRGTNIHTLCEKLVLNEQVDLTKEMSTNVAMYKQLERQLQAHANNVRVSEGSLFSHKLKVAGSVDLVSDWKGKPSIVDFKTSIRNKKQEWIENYFIQASMYSFMLWEMTGMHYPNIAILICVEEETEAQVFEDNASNWIDKARSRSKIYHERFVDVHV